MRMSQPERFEVLVLGSGTGGKLVAWHMAQSGRRTAVVERLWIGGSCVNVACMPSKNEISSAKVAHLARHAAQYGTVTNSVAVDMTAVRRRKREMVERQVARHLQNYKASGTELRKMAASSQNEPQDGSMLVDWRAARHEIGG